mmetsp:Transcript_37102/g.36689  ORF Transcript_37102/g.36689 Transcript_37102/m.36689 type:complete len:139 (-) Transcript_37102:5-421(-)
MEWHEGNIWKATVDVSSRVFCYKYVVVDQSDAIIRWEEGYNRICDLDIADKQGLCQDGEYQFEDKWGRFEMVFKLIHPLSDDMNRILRVSEPNATSYQWNEMKKPVEMHCTGKERLFAGSDKIKAYQGYSLIKQKRIY